MRDTGSKRRHRFFLRVQAPFRNIRRLILQLRDASGNEGSGKLTIDPERFVKGPDMTWAELMEAFVSDSLAEHQFKAFGQDLFHAVITGSGLGQAWSGIFGASDGLPLLMTVEFGRNTEAMAGLPLELLHDGVNFIFARPGAGLERILLETPARNFDPPDKPKLLFAWACPNGSGDQFDATPHETALRAVFGEGLTVLPDADLEAIEEALKAEKFDYLQILAHGFHKEKNAGIVLKGPLGFGDKVSAQRLANAVQGRGLRLVFLCSCQTAVAVDMAFSGVGQQLLSREGGDIPCVVATQANLPVRNSENLVGRFYRLLADTKNPAAALSRARKEAFDRGRMAWCVPVLLARPSADMDDGVRTVSQGLPSRKPTYQERPLEAECQNAFAENRLISLVGLPGIGKTETGREVARAALDQGIFQRVIYQEVAPGYTVSQVRAMLGTAVNQTGIADDEELAAVLNARPGKLLILFDNAEDLMKTPGEETAFQQMIDTLLGHAPRLSIFLTTRWPFGGTQFREREVEVPPMPMKQADALLKEELNLAGVLKDEWPGSPEWREILEIIDGHPRTLWLIAGHFDRRRGNPKNVLARLKAHKAEAVVEPGLLGRADLYETLKDDQKKRLKSLVASMNLSFEVLEKRHPDAAEVYMGLSLFPAGLPDTVAQEIAGGVNSLALEPLYHYRMAVWHNERTIYPVPLQWYAEWLRNQRGIDEARYMSRALDAFADYVIACDAQITTGAITAGVAALLAEEANLLILAEWAESKGEGNAPRSRLAAIASASGNGLNLAHRLDALTTLLNLGCKLARDVGDRTGEANTLKALGDLRMRVSDLEGAGDAYKDALPIYREIKDRLGEANTLKALGDYFRARGEYSEAVSYINEAMTIHLEIQNFLGVSADLTYLVRTLNGKKDFVTAVIISEIAFFTFQIIKDSWGQALILEDQGDAFQGMENIEGVIAAKWLALQILNRIQPEAMTAKRLAQFFQHLEATMGAKAYADLVEEPKQHAETTRRQAVLALWQTHRNNPLVQDVLARLPEKLTHCFEQ